MHVEDLRLSTVNSARLPLPSDTANIMSSTPPISAGQNLSILCPSGPRLPGKVRGHSVYAGPNRRSRYIVRK